MPEVVVVAGDGIGPEITKATLLILEATGVSFTWRHAEAGQAAVKQLGEPLPDGTVNGIKEAGLVLKGPLIAPKRSGRIIKRRDGVEVTYPSVNNALRRELGLFVNVRPSRSYPGFGSGTGNIDVVIMREVSEGIYSGLEHRIGDYAAEAIKVVTRPASERLVHFSFEYARRHGRRRVTLGHKANVLNLTDGLLLDTAQNIAPEYADITFDDMMVDALGMELARDPENLDVLILDNQYGDLLSDVCAGLVGSLGLAPGANYGKDVAMFEASHGAAPDIAGQGRANPISLILSGAMLLRHIEESEAAARIEEVVTTVLAEGATLTPDLGGKASTMELAEVIALRV